MQVPWAYKTKGALEGPISNNCSAPSPTGALQEEVVAKRVAGRVGDYSFSGTRILGKQQKSYFPDVRILGV